MTAFLLAVSAVITPAFGLPGLHSYVTRGVGLTSPNDPAQELLDGAQELERAVEDTRSARSQSTAPLSMMSLFNEPVSSIPEAQEAMPPILRAPRPQVVDSGSATLPLASAMEMHDQIEALYAQVQTLTSALQKEKRRVAIVEEQERVLSAQAQKLSVLAQKTVAQDGELQQQLEQMKEMRLEAMEKQKEAVERQKAMENSLRQQQDEFKSHAAAVIKAAHKRVEDAEAQSAHELNEAEAKVLAANTKVNEVQAKSAEAVKEAEAKSEKATSLAQQAVETASKKAAEAETKAANAADLEQRILRSNQEIASVLQRTREKAAKVVALAQGRANAQVHRAGLPTHVPENRFVPVQRPREAQMSLQTSQIRKRVQAPSGYQFQPSRPLANAEGGQSQQTTVQAPSAYQFQSSMPSNNAESGQRNNIASLLEIPSFG